MIRKLYWVQDDAEERGYRSRIQQDTLEVHFPTSREAAKFVVDMMIKYDVSADIRGTTARFEESLFESATVSGDILRVANELGMRSYDSDESYIDFIFPHKSLARDFEHIAVHRFGCTSLGVKMLAVEQYRVRIR